MNGGTRYASERYARAWRKWWRGGLGGERGMESASGAEGATMTGTGREEPQRFPIGESCDLLGIDRMTLKRWLDEAHMEPQTDTIDKRYKYLSREQIQTLARRHNRILRLEEQAPRPRLSRREREHQARLEAVEDVVRQLVEGQAQMTRLLEQLGAGQQSRAMPVLAPVVLPPAVARPSRSISTSANPLPLLPEGWRRFTDVARDLGVPETTARRRAEEGRWPAPHRGYWASGGAGTFPVTAAYDPEQIGQVRVLMGRGEDSEPPGPSGGEDDGEGAD